MISTPPAPPGPGGRPSAPAASGVAAFAAPRGRGPVAPVAGPRSSMAAGDVVLANPPPYATQPWLSMGVVFHAALLAEAGVRVRVARLQESPFAVPPALLHASLTALTLDPPMDARLAALEAAYAEAPALFDSMVATLLEGGERVVALSLFRNSADLSLWLARRVKAARPGAFVILGGPEAIDEPESLRLPWVDAVVSVAAESVLPALVRAALDGRPERAAALPNVWLNPALGVPQPPDDARPPLPPPPFPRIDYAPLVPLLVGDPQATMPLLLNWGCPYTCGFCANRNVYQRFTPGEVGRVLREAEVVVEAWESLHGGAPPGLVLQLSDATTNALPAQLDTLLRGALERRRTWRHPPMWRGQTLLDTRLTDERARLMAAADFGSTFFGLESASDPLRRALQKPGSIAQVRTAMETYHRAGLGGLHFGVPVGIPGEREADFAETLAFVDWAMTLTGTVASVTVLPYVFFQTAQDASFAARNHGARRGVLWRMDDPAGDPAVRAERFMRLFDHIDGRVPTVSPMAPYIILPPMTPATPPAVLDAWMERHGRIFDQIEPSPERMAPHDHAGHRAGPTPAEPAFAAACERAEAAVRAAALPAGWAVGDAGWLVREAAVRGRVVVLRPAGGGVPVALALEAFDATRRAFAQTRTFNVSYLKRWGDTDCAFDAALVGACVEVLRRLDGPPPPAGPARGTPRTEPDGGVAPPPAPAAPGPGDR